MDASIAAGQSITSVPRSVVRRFLHCYGSYLRGAVGLKLHEVLAAEDTDELLDWIVAGGPRPAAKRGAYLISNALLPGEPVVYVGKTFSPCGIGHRLRLHLTSGAHSPRGKPMLNRSSSVFDRTKPRPLADASCVQRVFPLAVERADVDGVFACLAVLEARIRIDTFCTEGPEGEHAAALLERGALQLIRALSGRLPPLNQRLSWITQGRACGRGGHAFGRTETLRLQEAERSFIAGFCAGWQAAS